MKALSSIFFVLLVTTALPVHAFEVQLTPTQLMQVKERLEKDTEDYTKYGFSETEKEEYYRLEIFLEKALEKDRLSEIESKALDRWDALSSKLLKAMRAKKHKTQKNRVLFRYVKRYPEKLEQIKQVIRAGADVNATDKYGASPLYYAVMSGYPEVQELLINAGANITPEIRSAITAKKYVDRALEHYKDGRYKNSCKYFVEAFRVFPRIAYFGKNNEYLDSCVRSYELDSSYTINLLKTIDLGRKYNFDKVIEWMAKLKYDPTSPLVKESANGNFNCPQCLDSDLLARYIDEASSFVYSYDEEFHEIYEEDLPHINHTVSEPYLVFASTVAKAATAAAEKKLETLKEISKDLRTIRSVLENK